LTSSVFTDPRSDKYKLEPVSDDRSEIILLRHGDLISSPSATGILTCVWHVPEVQVNSSAAELAHIDPSDAKDVGTSEHGDDTEDEAAPDNTTTEVPVTQPGKSQPSATPRLSLQHSLVVQETPTTDRVLDVSEYPVADENEDRRVETTSLHQAAMTEIETFSTARTGQQSPKSVMENYIDAEPSTDRKRPQSSPEVRIRDRTSKKRPSPTASLEPEPSAESRPVKRTKKATSIKDDAGDIMQNSPLDDLNPDPFRKTYSAKGKKRFPELPETTPSKSQRSSQRSATTTTAEAYEGPTPRVAFSNSAIKETSPTVKFLRKHGGTIVDSVEDKCNVLWYVISELLT
jgi:hypothetical protein